MWDINDNEYIDITMCFGANLFGHSPIFIQEALEAQLKLGLEIGPQSPMAGEVAELIKLLTGMERVTFCNTGSEAVMVSLRVARTVTGKDKIISFSGDYHGSFDEVLARKDHRIDAEHSIPVAPGIPSESVSNHVILEYGSEQALNLYTSACRRDRSHLG